MNSEFTAVTISRHDWDELQRTLVRLQERLSILESKVQREEDVRGYEEQDTFIDRYNGSILK